MDEPKRLPLHDRRVVDTWLRISEIKGRDLAYEIMRKLTDLENEHGFRFPHAFDRWAVHHISETQLKELENGANRFATIPELLEASGITWPPTEHGS